MKINDNPWPHFIVDDFFEDKDYDRLVSLAKPIYEHISSKKKIIQNITTDYYTKTYGPKALRYLDLLQAWKVEYYNRFQLDIQAVNDGEPSSEFVHVDRKDKLLSIVVYGYPINHVGTYIGSTRDNLTPIKWKPNRALIFSRGANTWHKFPTDGLGPRITFNINLYTDFFNE